MARKYLVSGDLKLELWYDLGGAWVRWQMQDERGTVTMSRQLPSRLADAGLG